MLLFSLVYGMCGISDVRIRHVAVETRSSGSVSGHVAEGKGCLIAGEELCNGEIFTGCV